MLFVPETKTAAHLGSSRPDWIPAFHGLRALAVLAVIVQHSMGPRLSGWAMGNLAVGVFFSLSGFLAYYVIRKDEMRAGAFRYNRYLLNRIIRIWPAYLAVIALVYVTSPAASANYMELFTFTINWTMSEGKQWPSPALTMLWTIAVEEQFYVVAPLMYFALRSRYAVPFCVAVFALSNVGRVAYILLSNAGPSNAGLYYFTLTYADTFLAGALVAHAYMNGWAPKKEHQALAFAGSAVLLVLIAWFWGPRVFPPYQPLAWLPYTMLPVACALLLASVLPTAEHRYTRLLSIRPLVGIGAISYGLYLVHIVAIQQAIDFWWPQAAQSPGIDAAFYVATVISGSIVMATALYFCVEQPTKKRLKPMLLQVGVWYWPAILTIGAIAIGIVSHWR